MLLPNVLYQFVFASSPRERRQFDPEKGPSIEVRDEAAPDIVEGDETSGGSRPGFTSTPPETQLEDDDEGYLTINDDNDNDDNIIHELEQEEYPNEDSAPTDTRQRGLSSFSSLEPLPSSTSRISRWWTNVKHTLDPRTFPSDIESFVPHYRYLPIISGVVIPFSILLEIPGLTEEWYIRIEADQIVDRKPNTVILDVALALSVVFAVMANACLIVRFMEKKVKYMTIACVVFLTIHGTFRMHPLHVCN